MTRWNTSSSLHVHAKQNTGVDKANSLLAVHVVICVEGDLYGLLSARVVCKSTHGPIFIELLSEVHPGQERQGCTAA